MGKTAVVREVRRLSALPLRRETVSHLLFDSDAISQPSLNRLIGADPALALAAMRAALRVVAESRPTIAQLARAVRPGLLLDLVRASTAPGGQLPATVGVLDRLWVHSVAVAHAARQLSRERGFDHPQTAFIAGLLHNVGLLAVAKVAPEAVEELLNSNDAAGLLAAERKRFGKTHAEIGRLLAKQWNLPHWLHDVIWWHHQLDGIPATVADRALVELVRDADAVISASQFSLQRPLDTQAWLLPWESTDASARGLSAGVRQTWMLLQDHALGDCGLDHARVVARTIELAQETVAVRAERNWQQAAWERWLGMPSDASPEELTGAVAETFVRAAGATGVLCYVRSDDGTAVEGTLWSDSAHKLSCAIELGAGAPPHFQQVVAHVHAPWQHRVFRRLDLGDADEPLAHVLLWPDEHGAADEEQLARAATLCTAWLERARATARLEADVDALAAALAEQSALAEAKLEAAKLAGLAEMAAGAGHEINNPLAVISGRAQLLLADESEPARRKALETIVAQATRIHRMIVDLMFFARPPAAKLQPLSLGEAVDRALAQVRTEAEQRRIALRSSLAPDLPLVSGDIAQLSAALACVLQNSLDAVADETGDVHVQAAVSDHTVELRVSDNGRGMSDEQRAHIFEPFYSGRDAGRGLGMGLCKAWSVGRNHGGDVVVDSTPDRGTTVTIRLPALADAAARRACA